MSTRAGRLIKAATPYLPEQVIRRTAPSHQGICHCEQCGSKGKTLTRGILAAHTEAQQAKDQRTLKQAALTESLKQRRQDVMRSFSLHQEESSEHPSDHDADHDAESFSDGGGGGWEEGAPDQDGGAEEKENEFEERKSIDGQWRHGGLQCGEGGEGCHLLTSFLPLLR